MILAIDLPFHGETEWKGDLFFDPKKLPGLIGDLLAVMPWTIACDRWWLLGYSMGGRVALSLLQMIPEKIERVILLAPDGLKVNGWYWLATQTRMGNRLFRWAMQRPAAFFFLLRIAGKLKWVNAGVYKFIFWHIDDVRVRDELYNCWTVMRGFRPDIPLVRRNIREHHVVVRLLYGCHDRIIRAASGERFRKGIESFCEVGVLDAGHGILHQRYLDEIVAAFGLL
jgi:pimeloyl-ACP methyl ester carboxylesterase